jgi:hypothetical protein
MIRVLLAEDQAMVRGYSLLCSGWRRTSWWWRKSHEAMRW